MKSFFICHREMDNEYFLFNGEWPIAIQPGSNTFGEGITTGKIIAFTEKLVPELTAVLNSKKKVFIINKQKYIITYRAQFIEE